MAGNVWQDREIRFDSSDSQLQPRPGEVIISYLEEVEDTKGNNGDKGRLYVTNLRVIWVSAVEARVNLCIGLKTIVNITAKKTQSQLRGHAQAIYLMTKQNKTQFEFIFTSQAYDCPRMLSSIMAMTRAYETTSLYREVTLRAALMENKEFKLLPKEQMYTKLNGVWNLCSDKGSLGLLFITNVRVVWQCKLNDMFNISIPYLQLKAIKIRDTKFGVALVLEAGKMTLGFKIDPYDLLKKTVKEIQSLHQVYSSYPIFGVEYEEQTSAAELATPTFDGVVEDVEVVPTGQDTMAAYLADPHKTQDREPVFSEELGLAIESLPSDYSLADLWTIS